MPSHPNRSVTIVALQAGLDHSHNGNPGPAANFETLAGLARQAAASHPDLILFPEYALSGWPYPPGETINDLAEAIPGDGRWFARYATLAQEINCPLVGWLVEVEAGRLYNTAFMLDRDGRLVGKYRKVQANLGEQTWWGWSQGDQFQIIELDGIRYGFSICADMWFPETVRCQELMDADLLLHLSISDDMGHIIPTRAFDSYLPIVAAIFNGGSYAVDDRGELLGKLPPEPAAWQAFTLHPFRVRTQAKYNGRWIPELGHRNLRNVEAYHILIDPATRPPWTAVFLAENEQPQTRAQLLTRFSGRYDANDPALYHQPLVSFGPPWDNPFYVDSDWPFHLVNETGRHLFIINKTAWAYFGCQDPAKVLQKARTQGVNLLRVALEGAPYFDQLGIDLWPWDGSRAAPDWSTMNEGYWQQVEERVCLAGAYGIGLDVVLYFTLHPTTEAIEAQRFYWEETLHRLGKYANILTWEIANEYIANEAFQDAAGTFFHHHDRYHRPVCTSTGTTDNAVWPDKPWVGLAINHTCTSSTQRHPLDDWYLALARNTRSHGKPAFCNESGRERRHRNDDGVHRRKQGWLWCAAGGFWTWHSWDGCEGINDPAYNAPGEEFLKPLADYFQTLPFWRLQPTQTAMTVGGADLVSAALIAADRSQGMLYLCTLHSGARVKDANLTLRLTDGRYRLTIQDPVNLAELATIEQTTTSQGHPLTIPLPPFVDDLVIRLEVVYRQKKI